MGKVISLNLQKGGVSKTTSCVAISFLLSQVHKKKVLYIDMDSQGNGTFILTQESPYNFRGRTILEALKEEKPSDYIINVGERLDLLPSNAFLATLPSWLYTTYRTWGKRPFEALRDLISHFKEDYDFIIIDTPPNLGDLTTNSIFASDFTIIPCESSMLAFQELDPQLELIEEVKKNGNKDLVNLGIMVNVIDVRRKKDNEEFFQGLNLYYEGMVFKTVIYRNAEASRIANENLFTNKKIRKAFKQYEPLVKEIINNVNKIPTKA